MNAVQLRQHLESLAAAGVMDVPRGRSDAVGPMVASQAAASRGVGAASPRQAGEAPLSHEPGRSGQADVQAGLNVLRGEVAACLRCGELAETRNQTVFGAGSPTAKICFLGEAPGADEDATGEPFVGKAGQLLTKIIEACHLTRNEVYILNVLKCRPPGNRRPLPDEVTSCRPFFERQLELVSPEVICCLGATAAQALLGSAESIGKLRGHWFRYRDASVICTYHPSYLLRNPAAKRDVWDDMKVMMRHFGVQL
jgi:uracil-DNA glycosylase family 4